MAETQGRTVLMTQRLHAALEQMWQALENEGPRPDYHRMIQQRHEREWPTLWRAIDEVQEAFEEQRILNGNPNAPQLAGLRPILHRIPPSSAALLPPEEAK